MRPALSRLHCLDLDEAGLLPPDWQAQVAALAAGDVDGVLGHRVPTLILRALA